LVYTPHGPESAYNQLAFYIDQQRTHNADTEVGQQVRGEADLNNLQDGASD
jgi:hypothetical protein